MPNLLELREEIIARIRKDVAEPRLLDIGCGQVPEEGFIGLDLSAKAERVENVDLYMYPWAIPDASVDYFRASHFVEHIPDWDAHFTQVYRCLKPGGHYEIISPYYLNNRWFQDPDHKQPILQERFLYLSREWKKANKIDHYGARVNFEVAGWFELLHEDFQNQGYDDDFIRWHKVHSFNVIDDIACILRKLEME